MRRMVELFHSRRGEAPSSGRAALGELLAGRGGYEADLASVTLAPFVDERVSLPTDSMADAPFVGDLLEGAARDFLEEADQLMLRTGDDFTDSMQRAPTEPYTDPLLRRRPRVYAKFIRRLQKLGMVEYRLQARERVGIFFVRKKRQGYHSHDFGRAAP